MFPARKTDVLTVNPLRSGTAEHAAVRRGKEILMTSVLSRSSRLAIVAALPLLVAARPLAAPTASGMSYDFIVRSQSDRSGNKEMAIMKGRGTFAGTDGRIDILESASGGNVFGGKGSYFLMLDGGKKMLLVDPTNKQYVEWDMANMVAGMSKLVNAVGGLVKMEMSDVKIDAHNLGPGQTIEGYRTVHYQMIQNYTMTVKIFGRGSKSRVESTTDYYFAPALKGLANPFVSNSQAWAQSFDMFNNPDYKSQMSAAMARIEFGVPVKTVIRSINTDDKGKQSTSVVTSEMVGFKSVDVPKSTFAIPTDYKMMEMPKVDANLTADTGGKDAKGAKAPDINADSIAAAAKKGAAEGAKDAVKEGAKDATAKKLKGIFKR
jgi:hypothetical protein